MFFVSCYVNIGGFYNVQTCSEEMSHLFIHPEHKRETIWEQVFDGCPDRY